MRIYVLTDRQTDRQTDNDCILITSFVSRLLMGVALNAYTGYCSLEVILMLQTVSPNTFKFIN